MKRCGECRSASAPLGAPGDDGKTIHSCRRAPPQAIILVDGSLWGKFPPVHEDSYCDQFKPRRGLLSRIFLFWRTK